MSEFSVMWASWENACCASYMCISSLLFGILLAMRIVRLLEEDDEDMI